MLDPALKLQLAFQGGGAKLVALIAAAEAVQQLENKGTISVTRLAGTSAGAIVAAFLAAKVPIPAIRDNLAGESGQALIREFPKRSIPAVIWHALRGKRFWDDAPLAKWLESQLGEVRKFSDLKKALFVYSANLEAGGAEVQIQSDLITALLESAGLPFCFRTWRSEGNTINVDGGLCQNLPVGDLLEDMSYGRVVGFSFPMTRPGRPANVLQFSMSLLDVAIGHSVESARSRLGPKSVCELKIPAGLTTFAFDTALEYLSSRDYSDTKEAVVNWFDQLAESSRSHSKVFFSHDIWREPIKEDVHSEMQKVGRIYEELSAHQRLRYKIIKLKVVGHGLLAGPEASRKPDEVIYELEFESLGDPLIAHHLTFSSSQKSKFFGQYVLQCTSAASQKGMPIEVLASISPDSEMAREVIVFFPPLKVGAYILSLQDQGVDLLAGLIDSEKRNDYLEIDPKYRQENIGLIQLAIEVPLALGEVSVDWPSDVNGTRMTDQQLNKAFGNANLGFHHFGWQGENIPARKIRVTFSV